MEVGDGGDQEIVHHRRRHTPEPAVLAGDGAQAVGEAKAHGNGLGVDHHGKIAARQPGQPTGEEGGQDIAHHNGPDVAGMGTGIAGSQHTEDDAQGHAVEGRPDEVVVRQNEQPEHAHVHEEHLRAQLGGDRSNMLRGSEQL